MKNHEDRGLEIAWQAGDDFADRLNAAGGGANDDDVVGSHT